MLNIAVEEEEMSLVSVPFWNASGRVTIPVAMMSLTGVRDNHAPSGSEKTRSVFELRMAHDDRKCAVRELNPGY